MKISIIGGGALGSALALNYASNQKKVTVWNRTRKTTEEILEYKFYPNQKPSPTKCINFLETTNSIEEVVYDSNVILLCIKAQSVYQFLKKYSSYLISKTVVFCSKGIDSERLLFQTEIGEKFLNKNHLAVLTGPGFAADIMAEKPVALTLACQDKKIGNKIQNLISTSSIRPYLSSDIVGAQIGGSLKNVIAIACGITEAKGLGDSARIAVMTRGFTEIKKIGLALGCELETLMGLSGLGDLTLTCNSTQSRNFNYGKQLVYKKFHTKEQTIEGKYTATAACVLADKFGVDVPIMKSVNSTIKGKISIDNAINYLLSRPLGTEIE